MTKPRKSSFDKTFFIPFTNANYWFEFEMDMYNGWCHLEFQFGGVIKITDPEIQKTLGSTDGISFIDIGFTFPWFYK